MVRIVTYNVNGLRARLAPPRTLLSFLDLLNSDIICFQETKTSRQELTADIAVADGYESFFSCTRTVKKGRVGYSGVATFCRIATAVPLAADEGFTGLLHAGRTGEIEGGKTRVGCYEEVLNMEGISRQELLELDSEGRCLVTDHGSFVLFNFYGPRVACGDEERFLFKVNFFRALQHRWEGLLKRGRRVIAVGDFNISPFPIDSCDPGPDFDSSVVRKWLRSMLQSGGGPFLDVFRVIHPDRKEAYTCWSQASGAEEFNYGTRIDLILAAGTCVHKAQVKSRSLSAEGEGNHSFAECEVEDCDILAQFKRFKADSLPRWVGGRNVKLEGSDHAPVFVQLREQPPLEPHEVPPLAARFMPELRGRQQSIVSLLQKRPYSSQTTDPDSSTKEKDAKLKVPTRAATVVRKGGSKAVKGPEVQKGKQQNLRSFFMPTSASKLKAEADDLHVVQSCSQDSICETLIQCKRVVAHSSSPSDGNRWLTEFDGRGSDKDAVPSDLSQLSWSQMPQQSGGTDASARLVDSQTSETGVMVSEDLLPERTTVEASQKPTATEEWQRIQKAMVKKTPLCKGHREPCVTRVVKKAGPNYGRAFHVCARAQSLSTINLDPKIPFKATSDWKRETRLMSWVTGGCQMDATLPLAWQSNGEGVEFLYMPCTDGSWDSSLVWSRIVLQGPSSNPEARCDHFEWNSSLKVQSKK